MGGIVQGDDRLRWCAECEAMRLFSAEIVDDWQAICLVCGTYQDDLDPV